MGGVHEKAMGKVIEITKNEKVDKLESFLGRYNLKHNQITRKVEINGNTISDRDVNTIYTKAMREVNYNISKNKIWDYIDSDFTQSYNPFIDFFEKNKGLNPKGRIKELLECIEYENPDVPIELLTEDEKTLDYLEVFLERWLLSIIASMHGTYSLLVLVLTGPQASGKSRFFRELLPKELQPYYAESKLDGGKDDEILMTQKLIVMDDEFSGKSKKEAAKLKDLSSKDSFTVRKPYGRASETLKRYAVLCGTSNEEQILNDPTGNRRLIPVNLKSIDLEKYSKINKVELFMELYNTYKTIGDRWMLASKEIAYLNKCTAKNEQPSIEKEMIQIYFEPVQYEGGKAIKITSTEIKNKLECRTKEKINVYKIGAVMKSLGYQQIRTYDPKTRGTQRFYLVIDNTTLYGGF
jgi:hypothetical protein